MYIIYIYKTGSVSLGDPHIITMFRNWLILSFKWDLKHFAQTVKAVEKSFVSQEEKNKRNILAEGK